MNRRRALVLAPLAIALVGVVPSSATAAGLPPLPEGYENFTPDIDYATLIGGAVSGSNNLTCTVTESNIGAFGVGSPFSPGEIQSDPFGKGVQLLGALNDPTKEGVASCNVTVAFPDGVRSTTGSITNAALTGLTGTDTGTFSLDCEMKKTVQASATVRFGGKVPGRIDVVVTGANEPIPFNCAIAITFGSSTLNGTVKGSASVVDPAVAGVCDGSDTISCAPIRLSDARVVITSSTGTFAGRTGEGTYSFTDSFSLPFLESQFPSQLGVTKSSAGRPSVKRSSVRASSVRAMSGATESMRLTLNKSASKTAILRPIGSTLAANGRIAVTGTARAACTLSAKVGRKSARIASFTLNASGRTSARAFTTKVARSIGARKNGKVTLTASCRGTNKKTSAVSRTVTYLG